MKGSSSGRDLQSLIQAVKSSDVVENRVQLLMELEELDIKEKSEVHPLIESLIILWEDFTCLDITQCTLNKTILHVAAKYLDWDVSECLEHFLGLGTKAIIWCRKHLKMTLMSTEDSQEEEHNSLFYQLLVDLLSFSSASYSASARYPVASNKELMLNLGNFISEQLTLIKDSVSEIKKIQTSVPELLKAIQVTLDAVIRLCRVYSDGVNWDIYLGKTTVENITDNKEAENADPVINVIKCTVEKLCELGVLAANDGGSLVSLLNMTWKGVVTLLQLGKGSLAVKVNIESVIMTLISLANESLRCAAGTWSALLKETVSAAEAKRIFLPVKFYLINAVRIISQYQCQAFSLYKDITLCVVMILTFRIQLSKLEPLRSASEVLAEILEPTSLHLLNGLLNSGQVNQQDKFQILDWLFRNGSDLGSTDEVTDNKDGENSLHAIFSVSSNAMNIAKILFTGRIALFINLLKSALDLEDDVRSEIARKLGWLLDILVDEDVYSSIFVLRTPIVNGSSQNQELVYQPMYYSVIHAVKTFMVVTASSLAWGEVESFLLENLFHPHYLCGEIVTELWCFMLRHAEPDMTNDIIDKLLSLLRHTAAPESVLFPRSPPRKIARLICMFLACGTDVMVDRVYNSIVGNNRAQRSASVYTALLMEGFPLDLLPEKTRSMAKQRIITEYFDFIENREEKISEPCSSGIYGAPVFALSAALQSRQVSLSDTEMKTLKYLVSMIHKYKSCADIQIEDRCCKLLGELLGIVSHMKHLYSSDEMEEVILELQKLFILRSEKSDGQLFRCKPNLASFMGGLGHMELADNDDSARSSAVWELHHMLLRERHWALVHLALTAFGYFAAHTSCNQLWRFVPQDAALSFDLESGSEADEERFMSALKAFLEKEMACLIVKPGSDQLEMLVREGRRLKELLQSSSKTNPDSTVCDVMEIDDEKPVSRKRKFPDGISKGVELLQSGLKVMGDVLSQWQDSQVDSTEEHKTFLIHFSRLEDVVADLLSLAGNS